MHTELLFRDEARTKLLAGANAVADAVRATLGPEARSVLLERKWGTPLVCDDGVTITKQIKLKDQVENLGAQLLRNAASETGDAVGDGTTTSTLLAHAIFSEGVRNVVVGTSAVGIKRGLQRGLDAAIGSLHELSRPVKDRTDTEHVATVSAHNDPEIGRLVADAVDQVGPEGVVEVEEAKGTETMLEVVEGMQLDKGYLSPYFVTDPERMEAVVDRPLVLLVDRKITAVNELLPVLEEVAKSGRGILIIAETVEGEALAALVVNRLRGSLAAAAVKAPGFGERRKAMLEDIGILTGTRPVSEELGRKLEAVTVDELGSAERVVITKDTTTIIGGGGDPGAVNGRCDELRRQIKDTTSDYDREKLEERLAKLSGGVALIRVGAISEAELKRQKEAFDDAISSTKAAVAEGIVPGGGAALLRTIDAVEAEEQRCEGVERVGVHILRNALEIPARQIAKNAGIDDGPVVEKIRNGTGFFGFDARTKDFAELDERGIIDPTKVVRIALQNAVAVAGVLLLAEATMVEVEEEAPPQLPEFG
ncbi:MAG TPA: chaperonin GroEL [Acidimicrobiales bacterium]|nr:chaperonin GroEL [Acidimicrobiales bacterium]